MSLVSLLSATVNSYAPPAPIIGTATILATSGYDGTTAQIGYTAPSYNSSLVPTITSFTVYAVEDPTKTATVATSASGTINVTGLTRGSSYTFKVYATNSNGKSPDSSLSNAVTATTVAQSNFTTVGSGTFTVPTGVTSISILLIGGGGAGGINYGSGGGGGALTYLNNYAVTPGQTFNINVGGGGNNTSLYQSGGMSWFGNSTMLFADGGHAGSDGLTPYINSGGGGGGAAGYAANGGDGGTTNNDGALPGQATSFSAGGAGGGSLSGRVTYSGGRGGAGWLATTCSFSAAPAVTGGAAAGGSGGRQVSAGGGGVGMFGQSSVDSAGNTTTPGPAISNGGNRVITNNGGSGGVSYSAAGDIQPAKYVFGGSGGGGNGRSWGANGVVRIVYPGDQRQFPSTNVGDY